MFKNIEVTQDLLDYIYNHTHPLHPVQKDILTHNRTLGDIQRMQISEIILSNSFGSLCCIKPSFSTIR